MMSSFSAGEASSTVIAPKDIIAANSGQISLERVAIAVITILDPNSTTAVRKEAHELCEAVKNGEAAAQYGFQLATLERPLPVRLFGLNILEGYVRSRLTLSEAAALRDGIWNLLALVVAVRPEERRLMQDKTAMLVAQLALRVWPQYWPDFFDRLLELVAVDGNMLEADSNIVIRTEMGLLMARMVVDEIHPRDSSSGNSGRSSGGGGGSTQKLILDDARRPELQKALSIVLPQMLKRLYSLLPHMAGWPPTTIKVFKPLLEAAMEAYGSIALWAALETAPAVIIMQGLVELARKSQELAGTALEVLLMLASRPSRPIEQALAAELFNSLVDPVGALLGQYASDSDSEGYENFKKLADFWVTLAATNMGNRKTPCVPERIEAVLDLLLQLSSYPSLLVASNVGGTFWNGVAKSDRIMTHPAMIARLPSLFLYALCTLAQARKTERIRRPYNTEDFAEGDHEADVDFEALFVTHQNRTMDLLRQIALHHPALLVGYCSHAVCTFLTESGGFKVELRPDQLCQWDALMHATDAILKASYTKMEAGIDADGSIAREIGIIGQILSNMDPFPTHPETLYLWFVGLRVLIPALGQIGSPLFGPLIQQMFNLSWSYEIPSNLGWSAQKTISMQTAIRARAGSTILKAGHARPSLFLPALDYLVGLFRQASGADESSSEAARRRRMLTELLLLVAGCIEGPTGRGELVQLVLSPIVEALNNLSVILPDNQELAMMEFLRHSGLGDLVNALESERQAQGLGSSYGGEIIKKYPGGGTEDQLTIKFRQQTSNLNGLLYIILGQSYLRRLAIAGDVRSLVHQFAPTVANTMGRLIGALHMAYARTNDGGKVSSVQWRGLFNDDSLTGTPGIPATEKMLDAETTLLENIDGGGSGRSVKGWIYMMRVTSYMNYGALFSLAPGIMYQLDTLSQVQKLLTASSTANFSLVQWMLLTRHLLTPMLTGLPAGGGDGEILGQLKFILLLLIERFGLIQLETAWQNFTALTSTVTGIKSDNGATFPFESSTGNFKVDCKIFFPVGSGGAGTTRTAAPMMNAETEVAQETLLTTATLALLTLLFDVLIPISERDKRVDPVLDLAVLQGGGGKPQAAAAAAVDPNSSLLARFIMRDEALSTKVILLLAAFLRWRPALTLGKTLAIISRWLPVMMEKTNLHSTLFGPISIALISAVSSSTLSDHHPAVTSALTELYKWQLLFSYNVFDQQIIQVLSGSPSSATATIRELRNYFQGNNLATIKGQRLFIKSTLIKALQQNALAATGVTSILPKLPDRLVVLRKLKSLPITEDDSLDLAALFDQ